MKKALKQFKGFLDLNFFKKRLTKKENLYIIIPIELIGYKIIYFI
jgi:hypothetical protein